MVKFPRGGDTMTLACPLPSGIKRLRGVEDDPHFLLAVSTRRCNRCPVCHRLSRRIHSRYWRTLWDLPHSGQTVRLRVQMHRFFCGNPDCSRRLFAERFPDFVAPYAQKTQRVAQAQTRLAQAVGSRPGVRLAFHLAVGTSATTLLRLERAAPVPAPSTPRVLGIDDWAFRRGHRYGTLLYDHERHCVVDLLSDRTTEAVAAWLRSHPGVEIVTRDRAECYAEAIRQGAPQAVQVADRWHLVRNLGQAMERVLDDKRLLVRQAVQELPAPITDLSAAAAELTAVPGEAAPNPVCVDETPLVPARLPSGQRLKQGHRQQRLARYEEVRQLWREGCSQSAICQRLHLDRKTIRKFLRADVFPERKERTSGKRATLLNGYEAYLRRRWEEGCHNVVTLLSELRDQGYTGGYTTLKDWAKRLRDVPPACPTAAPRVANRQIVAWLLRREEERSDRQKHILQRLSTLCEPFRVAAEFSRRFLDMIRHVPDVEQKQAFARWLEDALACDVAEMRGYAASLQRDQQAVEAGLSLAWSNGPVEGSVNRLKFVKRRGYGRANFDLLRRRVLNPV